MDESVGKYEAEEKPESGGPEGEVEENQRQTASLSDESLLDEILLQRKGEIMKRTINRNWHNVISEIFTNTKVCKCFCLENGFRGDECPKQVARNELQAFSSTKMRDNGDGTYTVKVHSNLWYKLYTV